MHNRYKVGVVGGTFDRFHIGHQKLIAKALEDSQNVIIGLATQPLYRKKYAAEIIEDYQIREKELIKYVTSLGAANRVSILPIHDIYGVTIQERDLQAIFVTEDTLQNAKMINEEREKQGFFSLAIIVVPFVLSSDSLPINSERIRIGEIDREGFVYATLFENKSHFLLPDMIREELKNPFGPLHETIEPILTKFGNRFIIAVGDVVVRSFAKHERVANMNIIDFKTQRKEINTQDLMKLLANTVQTSVANAAGTIAQPAADMVREAIVTSRETKNLQTIIVEGEEDLLVIPAILFAPLSAVIVYGQFSKGCVSVEVTEEKKNEISTLFKKFV